MPSLAVTVVGNDQPGIVADVTAVIADLGGNLADSSMTLLRGHFAMTLIADVPAPADEVSARLGHLQERGLSVSVFPVPDQPAAVPGARAVLSVHGADRPGLVHAATAVLAQRGGNITDLSTRVTPQMYVLTADVVLPPGVDLAEVAAAVTAAVAPMGLRATLRQADDEDVL